MTDVNVTIEYNVNLGGNTVVLDNKRYSLLKFISTEGSLTAASKEVNVSYKTALNYIHKIESVLGVKIVSTSKGGRGGGGRTELTDEGRSILYECDKINAIMELHKNINEIPGEVVKINEKKGMMTIGFSEYQINAPLKKEFDIGDKVLALVTYDNIVLMLEPQTSSIRNIFKGNIVEMKIVGEIIRVNIDVGGVVFTCDITVSAEEELNLKVGKTIFLGFKAMSVATLKL